MNNHLKIVIKPEDYRVGDGQLKLGGITTQNWISHFDFFVPQLVSDGDTDDCWDFGGIKNVDAFMDALMPMLPANVVAQITAWGFMDTGIDGLQHFHSSPRFPGVMTGIGRNGGNVNTEYDFTRNNGLVPFRLLPVTASMTLAEYFDPAAITQDMKNIGLEFLALMGGKNFLQYAWVNDGGKTNIAKMASVIANGPLSVGIPVNVNGWNQVHPAIAIGAPVHVVSAYEIVGNSVYVSDNYPPFLKILDPGYQMSYVVQVIVQYIPPALVVPATPTSTIQENPSAWSLWLSVVSSWLQNLLERTTPSGRAKLGGASRSDKWPAFKKEFAKTHTELCAVCGGTDQLNLHHLKPFHVFPELELDPANVIWLCNAKECHIRIGHLGNFQSINPDGKKDIQLWHDKITKRPMTSRAIKADFDKNKN